MYGRIVLDVPGEDFDRLLDAAKERAGATSDAEVPVESCGSWSTRTRPSSRDHTGKPFPQDPADQLRGAIEAVFGSWNGPRAIAYRDHEGIPHDLGTAVNVQAMVFGNRDDHSGTGVGLHPRPRHRGQGRLRRLPRERPGRGRRGRDPQHRAALRAGGPASPRSTPSCGHLRPPRAALPRHVRHRVHHRAGQALDAADPRGQAHRPRRAAHGGRDDHGRRHPAHPRRGGAAGHGRAPRPGLAPAVRRHAATRCSPRAWARRRGRRRSGLLHRRRRRRGRRSEASAVILVRSETSPEDVHGMLAAEGILTARGGLVSHAAVVARGWGKPAVVGAEQLRISGECLHGGGRHRAPRATGFRSTGPRARSCWARWRWPRPSRPRSSTRCSGGPTTSARAIWRCGPTPTTAPTPPTPGGSGPRASGCAAPSTCSSPRTAFPSCAA